MHPEERRHQLRIPYVVEVWLESSIIPARIADLSVTGAFIDTRAVLNPGTRVKLRFAIGDTSIEATALVRYSVRNIGMGVSFLDLTPEHRAAVEALVADRREAK